MALTYFVRGDDPPYGGPTEIKFTREFCSYQGASGYAKCVSTGTLAVYAAITALDLSAGDEIVIPPVTDGGAVSAAILANTQLKPSDSVVGSYNTSLDQIKKVISSRTKAVMVAHIAGEPISDIADIAAFCANNSIWLIEDCSQATGSEVGGVKVGNFGDLAAFSIMYRKNLSSGGSGGIVYSRRSELRHKLESVCDRGKQTWRQDLNQNDPSKSLFPALNLSWNEFSSAIARSSLKRLGKTIQNRRKFTNALYHATQPTDLCKPISDGRDWSPFFMPIRVAVDKLVISKVGLAHELQRRGVSLLPHYGCVVSRWPWIDKRLYGDWVLPNAEKFADSSFNLFLNEKYSPNYAKQISAVMREVSEKYRRV